MLLYAYMFTCSIFASGINGKSTKAINFWVIWMQSSGILGCLEACESILSNTGLQFLVTCMRTCTKNISFASFEVDDHECNEELPLSLPLNFHWPIIYAFWGGNYLFCYSSVSRLSMDVAWLKCIPKHSTVNDVSK